MSNIFKPQKQQQQKSQTKYLDVKDEKLFPALHQASVMQENSMNFKDILNTTQAEVIVSKVAPGWVNIKNNKRKMEFTYGDSMKQEKEETLDDLMNKAIGIMVKRWDEHERQYDEIHGEGEFYERYLFSESDYVTDEEEDDEEEDEDEDDLD
jgi:hypothetical protein